GSAPRTRDAGRPQHQPNCTNFTAKYGDRYNVIALNLTHYVGAPLNPRTGRAFRAGAADFERCSMRRDIKR
ncbi:MAG TPA: hypothetical protein VGX50_17640, partial [Longimicrobium sp.]|nr:hypothetical protein [Longimicrobium sp.]